MLGLLRDRAGMPTGIRYEQELPADRDDCGVLWAHARQSLVRGRPAGRPRFGQVHPFRQREAMSRLRCNVCMGQPSRNELGYLFLEAHPQDPIEGRLTIQPPLCLPHALDGIERCSFLRNGGYVLLRSRVPRLHGVVGCFYRPGADGVEAVPSTRNPNEDIPVAYARHELTPWLLASQMVRRLTKVTVVSLDDELRGTR
jgi:hypothetical protein